MNSESITQHYVNLAAIGVKINIDPQVFLSGTNRKSNFDAWMTIGDVNIFRDDDSDQQCLSGPLDVCFACPSKFQAKGSIANENNSFELPVLRTQGRDTTVL